MNDPNPTPNPIPGHPAADDDLSMVRHLLAEPPPPTPDVAATAHAALDQAIRHQPRRTHQPIRPLRTVKAHRLPAAAAAALILAGGAAYGLTAGPGGSAARHPVSTTALTTVSRCPAVALAEGTLVRVHGTSFVVKTQSGRQQTVTTSSGTNISVAGAALSDIADGQHDMVIGTKSHGSLAAGGVVVASRVPKGTIVRVPAPLVTATGVVTDASSGSFTLATSTGARVQVTMSGRTNVFLASASASQLQTGADIVAIGRAGPAGALAAASVSQVPNLPNLAHFRTLKPHSCSASAITTAYLGAASAPAIP
ncbi:MAG: hypothetical protein ACRDNF_21135 [Streptosporangiaceae bacterium]